MSGNSPLSCRSGTCLQSLIQKADGSLQATLSTSIRKVGIGNLCDIESHAITRIANSTSHFVRFIGGGDLQYAFTDKGELLQLSGHGIQFSITDEGVVDASRHLPQCDK